MNSYLRQREHLEAILLSDEQRKLESEMQQVPERCQFTEGAGRAPQDLLAMENAGGILLHPSRSNPRVVLQAWGSTRAVP